MVLSRNPQPTANHRNARWPEPFEHGSWPALLVLTFGVLVTLGLSWQSWHWSQREHQLEDRIRVELAAQALDAAFDRLAADVQVVARYLTVTEDDRDDDLAAFARVFLERESALRAVAWAPRVAHEQRAAVEADADGTGRFRIREPTNDGPRTAPERPDYFPIYRVAPAVGHEALLGLDLAFESTRRAALEQASATARVVATEPLRLCQANGGHLGMLLFAPVYQRGAALAPADDPRREVKGFAVAVVRLKALASTVLDRPAYRDFVLLLRDTESGDGDGIFYRQSPPPPASMKLARNKRDELDALRDHSDTIAVPLSFGGRRLELLGTSASGHVRAVVVPFFTLVLGLTATLALSWLLWRRQNESRRLRISEERLRVSMEAAQLGYWDYEPATGAVLWSGRHEQLWGYEPGEFNGTSDAALARIHPGDRSALVAALTRSQAEDCHFEQEFRVIWPTGRVLWILSRGESITNADGRVTRIAGAVMDISARKSAEQALYEHQARLEDEVAARTAELTSSSVKLQTIYDLVPVGIAITDPEGWIIDCNRESERLLRLTREEHIRRAYDGPEWRLLRPDRSTMPPEEYASVRALREQRLVSNLVMGVDHPDAVTWLSVSAMPADHPDYGVVIAFVDITERLTREEALRASEQKYRGIFDESVTAIAVFDQYKRFIDINQAGLDLLGYSREELLRLRMTDLDADPSATLTAQQILLSGGYLANFEHNARRKDGAVITLLSNSRPLFNAAGDVVGMLSTLIDISDRKRTEAARRAAETALQIERERLQYVIDGTHAGAWEWQVQTDAVTINDRWATMLGYGREELEPITIETWRRLTHPDDLAEAEARIKAHCAGETPRYKCELRMRHKAGHWVWIDDRGKVVRWDDDGRPALMSGTHQDITRLKEAQQDALRTAQAQARFLAQMSHEIRTPMNGIIGLSELALRGSLDARTRDYLDKLHQSGVNLLGILNDILDQSKIQAGHMNLESTDFELGPLLDSLHALFGQVAEAKGLELVIEVAPEAPDWLVGDPLRLRQILSNLLGNSLKFTKAGRITVRVTRLETQGRTVLLRWEVEDTGIGMDQATRERLFQAFTQGDHSTARHFGGTGLGLSISQHLVELMGSRIEVDSQPGRGSRFRFDLTLGIGSQPLVPASTDAPDDPAHTLDLSKMRVLVAEDQPVNQLVIGSMLRLLGIVFDFANDGQEALACLAQSRYDLVLMDVQMPELDGLEATREIRANPDWAELPVIALTAGVTETEREQMTAAGMNDMLAKPVTIDAVRDTLRTWLGPAS